MNTKNVSTNIIYIFFANKINTTIYFFNSVFFSKKMLYFRLEVVENKWQSEMKTKFKKDNKY